MKQFIESALGLFCIGLAIILMVVIFSTFTHAQIPYASGGIQVNGNMGYLNPIVSGKFGAENFGKHVYVNSFGEFQWARKIETGDGHTFGGLAEVAYVHKGAFVGGGLSAIRGYTSDWQKGSLHPLVMAGYDNWYVRFTGRYRLAGTDDRNGAQSFGGEMDWKLSKRWRFNHGLEVVKFHETDCPELKRTGIKMWYGVKFLLKNDPIKGN